MKISNTYRRLSLLLVGLMLLSTVGLRLDVHYCQGQLAGANLILPELDSCHAADVSMCCSHDNEHLPCCEDEEMMASLDYDGPVATYLSADRSDQDVENFHSSIVKLRDRYVAKLFQINTGPPLDALPSGVDTRIRFQSFLC